MEYNHISVLARESIKALAVKKGGTFFDGTCGGGGHSLLIAEILADTGLLICADKDADAIAAAKARLKDFTNIVFIKNDFKNINEILDNLGIEKIDGALLDLGVSSYQMDEPSRGFSFRLDGVLDMRMDKSSEFSAFFVVNSYSPERLRDIISEYGEERFAGRISGRIAEAREKKPIETTLELAEIVSKAIPRASREAEKHKHPATRTFQAIRIEVNNEISGLGQALEDIARRLDSTGRLCCISFHSLEDRIVKNTFNRLSEPCTCPKSLPYCVCERVPSVKKVTRKPIVPTEEEVTNNPRARSAKLRAAEKL